MKYRLKKDLPWFKAGTIIEAKDLNQEITESEMSIMDKDWFEPVEDRIELEQAIYNTLQPPDYYYVGKKNKEQFTPKELKSMEQDINGEKFSKGDMKDIANFAREGICRLWSDDTIFNEWLKK